MKAVLALVFFACIAGSMASNPLNQLVGQLVQTGQAAAQTLLGQLQQQIAALAQAAVNQLSNLAASLGGRSLLANLNLDKVLQQLLAQVQGQVQGLLQGVLGQLTSIIGGGRIEIGTIFNEFLASIQHAVTGLGQHFLNQGLSAVLGSLGGRGIGDIFAGLSQQISSVVSQAQGALSGILGNLQGIAAEVIDSAKPHFQQLQEQLVGHGLNALGSLSETINNLHGSITGGR